MSGKAVAWIVSLVVLACGSPPSAVAPVSHGAHPVASGVPRPEPVAEPNTAQASAAPCGTVSLTDLAATSSPFPGVVALDAKPTWAVLEGSRELLSPDPFDSASSEAQNLAFVLPTGAGKLLGWGTDTELTEVLADGAILVSKSGCVQRLDLPSGQVRWAARMEQPLADDFAHAVVNDAFAYRNGTELGVLDLKGGARAQPSAIAHWLASGELVADNGQAALLRGPNALAVIDPTSDRTLWAVDRKTSGGDATIAAALGPTNLVLLQGRTPLRQQEHACSGHVLFDPEAFADSGDPAWCQSRLVSLTTDGRVVKELPWTQRLGRGDAALLVDGNEVYVSMPERIGRFDGRRIDALTLPNLTQRWRTRAVPCGEAGVEISPDSVTKIQLTNDAVFVCGCDGVLRRFARDTGKETGSFGVGMCHGSVAVAKDAAVVPMTKGTAASGEVTWNPWSSWCAEERCTHHLLVIGSQAFSAPAVSQTVAGKVETAPVQCDLTPPAFVAAGPYTVRIGDRLIQTTAAGAFKTELAHRGILSVDILSPDRWEEQCALFDDRPVTVAVDGKPHASLSPALRQFPEYVLGAGP